MKFLDSTYSFYGTTVVWLDHLKHKFKGIARLHPEDADRASELVGGRIAETRATIAALKYERKLSKEESEIIRKFVKKCEEYKNFDKTSPTAKAMYKQLGLKIKKVNQLADIINDLMIHLQREIVRRDVLLNKRKETKDKVD